MSERSETAPSPWGNPAAQSGDAKLTPGFSGGGWPLFSYAFTRMLLTILTLGIARFWMLTGLRRHYWSSLKLDGSPFEYTGRAMEKLTGFFIAVVILAVVLYGFNAALFFAGIVAFGADGLFMPLSLIVVLPLFFWARYRARRYVMARTRWRGIRFGLEPGAWGYAWRALFWWGVTVVSLGLLFPVKQLRLARYIAARSWFGDQRFEQKAALRPLMISWLLTWAAPAVLIGASAMMAGRENLMAGALPTLAFLALPWLGFMLFRHQVVSFRHLVSGLVLGGGTRLEMTLSTGRVAAIYLFGALMVALTFAAAFAFVLLLISLAGGVIPPEIAGSIESGRLPEGAGLEPSLSLAIAAIYLLSLPLLSALTQCFIRARLVAAAASGGAVINPEAARRARQRGHDEQAEAGGFADAMGADAMGGF